MLFVDRDVENDPGAWEELHKLGVRSIPTTVIGNQAIIGFNPEKLAEAIKIDVRVLTRGQSETIPIVCRALEAA